MAGLFSSSQTIKRLGLYGLILLTLGLMTSVVIVLATEDPVLTDEEAFPEPVILDPEKRPSFVFPVAARTTDLTLNRFIDRFARVCMQGKYSDFRQMLSSRRPPILPPRFESNFNALKRVQVVSIERLPDFPGATGPVYVMTTEYELQDYAAVAQERTKRVEVALAQEDGEWRLGPLPPGSAQMLANYRAGNTPPPAPIPESQPVEPPENKKTGANQPARLDS